MKKLSFLTGFIMIGLAGTSFASDPEITLNSAAVDVTSSDQTIGFTTNPPNENLQIEFIQDPQNGVAALYGGGSSGQQIFLPKGTYAGEWIVNRVYDPNDAAVDYRRDTIDGGVPLTGEMAALLINVTNSNPDTAPPEVTTFDIDLDQLTKSDDGQILYAPCTITVTDNNSGFGSLEGSFSGTSVSDADVTMLISQDDRIGDSNVYQGYVTFLDADPGQELELDDILLQDNAGNAIYYSLYFGSKTRNNFTVNRTEPIPSIYSVTIQLPSDFNSIPLRNSSGSGASPSASSSSTSVVQSVKKSKKGKKGKKSAKGDKSSKKKDSSAKKSKGSKKSSAKKSKSARK